MKGLIDSFLKLKPNVLNNNENTLKGITTLLGYIVVKFYFLFLKVPKFDINVWTTVNTFEECQD